MVMLEEEPMGVTIPPANEAAGMPMSRHFTKFLSKLRSLCEKSVELY